MRKPLEVIGTWQLVVEMHAVKKGLCMVKFSYNLGVDGFSHSYSVLSL